MSSPPSKKKKLSSPNPNLIIDDPMQEHQPDTNPIPNPNPEKQDAEEDLRIDPDQRDGDEDAADRGSDSGEEADDSEEEEDESDDSEEEEDESDEESGSVIKEVITKTAEVTIRREVRDLKLNFPWSCLVSIESANLTLKTGADAPRRHDIYGKIMVNSGMGKVYPFYKLEQDQPRAVLEGHSYNLTLCGPNYSLNSDTTYYIHVRLYEKGPDGSTLPFLVGNLFFDSPKHFWAIAHKPVEMKLDGERAALIVNFTRFFRAMPFQIRISLPVRQGHDHEAAAPLKVYGDVEAIQTVRPSFKRTYVLLHRAAENGTQVSAGEQIPLDRSLVVSPIQREVIGPSLTIKVNLCFVQHGNEHVHQLYGEKNFIFSYEDRFSRYAIIDTIPLRSERSDIDNSSGVPDSQNIMVCSDIENSSGVPDSLKIMVYPVLDCYDTCSDEEDAMEYEKFESDIKWEHLDDPTFYP